MNKDLKDVSVANTLEAHSADVIQAASSHPEQADTQVVQMPTTQVAHSHTSKRLDAQEQAQALRMLADGTKQAEVARVLGVTQSAISLLQAKYAPTVDAARALIQARASSAAKHWWKAVPRAARKGDHRPAKDWLTAAGVVAPETNQAQQVVIHVGVGKNVGQPTIAQDDPFDVIDVSAKE